MTELRRRFIEDDRGSAAIEYALVAVFVGLGVIVALMSLRDEFGGVVNTANNGMNGR